jgi:hypothetical protein
VLSQVGLFDPRPAVVGRGFFSVGTRSGASGAPYQSVMASALFPVDPFDIVSDWRMAYVNIVCQLF